MCFAGVAVRALSPPHPARHAAAQNPERWYAYPPLDIHPSSGYAPRTVGLHDTKTAHFNYLLSFEAWGQVGQVLIYDRNRSGPFVRAYRVPANPNTPKQQAVRDPFRMGVICSQALT